MPIDVQCSSCGKRLRAPDEQAGRKGRCPACKAELAIPAIRSSANTSTPELKAAASIASAVVTPPPITESRSSIPPQESPQQKNEVPSTSDGEAVLEAKHWFALSAVLQITKNALLLSWISLGLLGLELIGTTLTSRSTAGDAVISQAISFLRLWGMAGTFFGWAILFTGWLMCLTVWPAPERRWLHISIMVTGVLIAAFLILFSLEVFGIGDSSNSLKIAISKTIPTIAFGLATVASLLAFGKFLADLETRMGNEPRPRDQLIRAIVICVLMIWCIAANLFFEPNMQWKVWLFVISNLAGFLTPFLWLWLLNVHVSGHLRVSQAWKRL